MVILSNRLLDQLVKLLQYLPDPVLFDRAVVIQFAVEADHKRPSGVVGVHPDSLNVAVDVYHDEIRGELIGRSFPVGIDLDFLGRSACPDRDLAGQVVAKLYIGLYVGRMDHFKGFTINLDKFVESL